MVDVKLWVIFVAAILFAFVLGGNVSMVLTRWYVSGVVKRAADRYAKRKKA